MLPPNFIQLAAPRTTGWTPPVAAASVLQWRADTYSTLWSRPRSRAGTPNMHGGLLEAQLLPPGSGLKRAFFAAMLEWIDAGWQFGEFSSRTGVFFSNKGVDRRQIEITPTEPFARGYFKR